MRIKSILTAALLLFVVAAVAVVITREMGGRAPSAATEVARESASPIVEEEVTETLVADATVTNDTPVVGTAVQAADDPRSEPVAEARSEPAVAMHTVADTVSTPAVAPEPEPAKKRRILAYYFHGNVRCSTCRTIEVYAREAVEQGFQDEIARGSVVFVPVNVEQPENRHFITDFQLMTRTVVIAEEIDGTIGRWRRLDEVWQLVGRRAAYLDFVRGVVNDYLEQG